MCLFHWCVFHIDVLILIKVHSIGADLQQLENRNIWWWLLFNTCCVIFIIVVVVVVIVIHITMIETSRQLILVLALSSSATPTQLSSIFFRRCLMQRSATNTSLSGLLSPAEEEEGEKLPVEAVVTSERSTSSLKHS